MNRLQYILATISTFRKMVRCFSFIPFIFTSADSVRFVSSYVSFPVWLEVILFILVFQFLFSLVDFCALQIERSLSKDSFVSNRRTKFVGYIAMMLLILGNST